MPHWLQTSLTVAALVLVVAAPASAQSDQEITEKQRINELRIADNFAYEYAQCAAYYVIISSCNEGYEKQNVALRKRLSKDGNVMINKGIEWALKAGQTRADFTRRLEDFILKFNREIDQICYKLSNLEGTYEASCKFIFENPDERLRKITSEMSEVEPP